MVKRALASPINLISSAARKKNIPIRVPELEPTQAITRILDWHKKLDIAGRELCRQRIRIGDVDVRVPAGNALFDVPCVVRHWSHADFLEHEHRAAALNNAEKDIVRFGPLKCDLKPETVAIKSQRGRDILHDEERRNAGDLWFHHLSFSA